MINDKFGKVLASTAIFLILNALFFGMMFYFVYSATNGSVMLEKTYSRQIALIADSMKQDTEVILNVAPLYEAREKTGYKGEIFDVNYDNSTITIKLTSEGGNSYQFFTQLDYGDISWDDSKKQLIIKT